MGSGSWLLPNATIAPAALTKAVCPRDAGQLTLKLQQIAGENLVLDPLDCLFCTAPTSRRGPKGTGALLLNQRNEELRVKNAATQCLAFSGLSRLMASIAARGRKPVSWAPPLSLDGVAFPEILGQVRPRRAPCPQSAGEKSQARQGFCASGLERDRNVAWIAACGKKYYTKGLKETILRLFADGTFLGEWFFATFIDTKGLARRKRCGPATPPPKCL